MPQGDQLNAVGRGACKGCGAQILWVKNEKGKPEPFDGRATRVLRLAGDVDPDGTPAAFLEAGKRFEIQTGHLNHFLTCPKAAAFRPKPKTGDAPR